MFSPREIAGCSLAGVLIAATCVGSAAMNNRQKRAVVRAVGGAALRSIVVNETGNTLFSAAIEGLAAETLFGGNRNNREGRETATGQSALESCRDSQQRMLSMTDVIDMSIQGISDSIIIERIRARGGIFDISPQAIIYLKRFSVSDAVIQAMQDQAGHC